MVRFHLDKVIGAAVLTLGVLALAAGLSTDAYSHGAQAQALGYNALTHLIVNNGSALCLNDAASQNKVLTNQDVTQ